MPTKGTSRQSDRDCLVCGETTRIAHLGIECCRACAVFYRRAKRGNDYVCRSRTDNCATGKGLNCKRCRYDRIVALLAGSAVPNNLETTADVSTIEQPSAAIFTPTESPPQLKRALLERVLQHYKTMCFNRLSNELNSRPNPPHPLDISIEHGPFFLADFAGLTQSIRILSTATLEFGRNWKLAMNFFYRFRMFEGCYRSRKVFTNDPDKFFVSYATYFTVPFSEFMFTTAPEGADTVGALEFMRNCDLPKRMQQARELVSRVNPSEAEFLTVAVLMFWATDGLGMSEDITRIAERYRETILKELHAYYRDAMGIDDYATRLGELMMLMQVFDGAKDLNVHFEVLRLFNVMTEDNFIYQLKQDLIVG